MLMTEAIILLVMTLIKMIDTVVAFDEMNELDKIDEVDKYNVITRDRLTGLQSSRPDME